MTIQTRTFVLCLASVILAGQTFAQSIEDKLSVGLRFGPNLWVNDMNDRKVGVGIEAVGRYGVTPSLSLGGTLGYDALKAHQYPLTVTVPIDYVKVNAWHASLDAWLQLSSSKKFQPYLSVGFGGLQYTRKDGSNLPYPITEANKVNYSVYVPFSVGFEAFVNKNSSVTFDFGYRLIDPNTDNLPDGSDAFTVVKFGYTMYFGSNDDDDDDGDGLTNGQERELGTNPNSPDTDGDGLSDKDEVLIYKTNPAKADTDGDGLSDGDEVWRFRTDPNKPDTDNDGLSDGAEISTYNTDPLKPDTDGDGLTDGEEVLTYHTDPLKADTDGDGVTDANEILAYHTDPLKADTDGGGVDDGTEIRRGTNPLVKSDDIPPQKESVPLPQVGDAIILDQIKFGSWSAHITPPIEFAMGKILEMMALNPDIEIEIRSYTDDRGGKARNAKVSQERADALKKWLEARGISSERITAKGFGQENPVAPNTSEEGREKNRRVEFVRTK